MSYLGAQNSIALGVQGLIHIDTGTGGGAASYNLASSLRFRSSASAYLSRTFSADVPTFTLSVWCKRGNFTTGVNQQIIASSRLNLVASNILSFSSADSLYFEAFNTPIFTSTAVFRDPAAWYHVVLQVTQSGTAYGYINGVQVASGAVGSLSALFKTGYTNVFGRAGDFAAQYFDGELAEVNFVDGQALTAASFGATGANSQWLPIAYAGTYGTNGFYLPFTNTTSTTTLVADSSGNGNNWTPNNISLTAGSTYDSLTDVPTLTSTTVANYAVLNPLAKTSAFVLSNANLTYTANATSYANTSATIQIPATGKWYFEVYINTLATYSLNPTQYDNIKIGIQGSDGLYSIDATDSVGFANYSVSTPLSAPYVPAGLGGSNSGDTMMVAYDAATGKLWLGAKGSWSGGGNPSTGTTPTFTTIGTAGTYFPRAVVFESSVGSANFGQQPWIYSIPTDFLPLNTFNIAAGTVTTSGTFTGNASTDGPMVYLNGTPTAMTINGNAVVFGTQADKLANGFKVRSSSASYNASGSNTYIATTVGAVFKYEDAQSNP